MAIRTKAEIARDIKAWLEARIRVVDTGAGTPLSSLMLEALATVLAEAYTALGTAETAQGLGSPSAVDPADLDDIAYNLGITRRPAAPATGFVTFRRTTAPASTIRVGAEDGSGGVVVLTGRDLSGAASSFKTTQTVFFTSSTTKNPATGFYEVAAPLQASQAGTSGNVAAGTITVLASPAQGVTSVVNKSATANGKDQESNASLASRMASKLLGFQPGILDGLRSVALGEPGVQDASVVGPDDAAFQRSLIGAVDLVIKGSSPTLAVDQFTYAGPTAHVLTNRPVLSVGSVVSTVGLTQGSLVDGAQWVFSQDTVSEQRLSTSANDHVSWLGTNLPNAGAQVVVTYTYDALIATVQSALDSEDAHYPAASPMAKRASQVLLDIAFTVVRNGAVDATTMANAISTAISDYVAGLGLGVTVTQSGLVSTVKAVSGIRQLVLPFSSLSRRGAGGAADVVLTQYEYPQIDEQSVTVTFTN